MPSNREAYFEALKLDVPKSVIEFALKEVNDFSSFDLTKYFDNEIKDYPLFNNAIKRYIAGEMIEYVFQKTYFLSSSFYLNKNVLIPRQETEQLVLRSIELIKEMFDDKEIAIADVCTGSGCIGISIAKNLPNNQYYLTDISKDAIKVAKQNADSLLSHGTAISFLIGDMLEPLNNEKIDVVVCNPPYIENIEEIDKKTWEQEPHLALLASPSTLFYEKVFMNYETIMNEHFLMAFEIGEDMQESLTGLINKYLPKSQYFFEKDMYAKTRFLFIKQ